MGGWLDKNRSSELAVVVKIMLTDEVMPIELFWFQLE
jgi:hypothetical protein